MYEVLARYRFLFYGTEHGGYCPKSGGFARPDPSRPVENWRRAWKSIMEEAKVSKARFYDSRHTAVTDLLQNPAVSEEVAKAIVGHVSRKMLERYSHQRLDAKRQAVAALSPAAQAPQNNETAPPSEEQTPAHSYN